MSRSRNVMWFRMVYFVRVGPTRLPPDRICRLGNLAGNVVGARALALQPRDGLRAHPLDIARFEARRGQREAQQMERLVLVFLQRAQVPRT